MDKSLIKQELLDTIVEYNHKFYDAKLTPSHDSGDLSLRDPETGLIYVDPRPSDTLDIPDWRVVNASDVVVFDIDGNMVWAEPDRYETVEMPMHLAIYRAYPEVNAIVHSHALWSSCFAVVGEDIPCTLAEQALYIGGVVRCAEYGPVGSIELADNIVKAMAGGIKAALLRNHGAVAVGADIAEAFSVAEYLEHCAQTTVMARAMGGKLLPIDMNRLVDPSITI